MRCGGLNSQGGLGLVACIRAPRRVGFAYLSSMVADERFVT